MSGRYSRRGFVAAFAAVGAVALAACGSAPPTAKQGGGGGNGGSDAASGFAKYANMSADERQKALVADAKKEGQVVVYTSNTDIDALAKAFEAKYPGVDVKPYRADSETLIQRLSQESSAGKIANDALETDNFEMIALDKNGDLAKFDSPVLSDLPDSANHGGWVTSRLNTFFVAWNTKLVQKGGQPKSFLDLADPKWKGKIGMEEGDFPLYAGLTLYLENQKGMSKSDVRAYWRKVAANAKVVSGHTVLEQLLDSGEFSVAMGLDKHFVEQSKEAGAPVAWTPYVEPVIAVPSGLGVMKKAPHPAAGILFTEWLLARQGGQEIYAQKFRVPIAKNVPGEKDVLPSSVEVVEPPDSVFTTDVEKWRTDYQKLLQGSAKVEGDDG